MTRTVCLVLGLALVLLVFAMPASASHVSCGDTVTTDTVLDGDITCTAEDDAGLLIGASNITLWMNGHHISGSPTNTTDTGITSTDSFGSVTIRGGTGGVRNFEHGIRLSGDDNSVLRTEVDLRAECSIESRGIQLTGARAYAYRNVVVMPPCGAVGIELSSEVGRAPDPNAWGNDVTGGDRGIVIYGDRPLAWGNTVRDCQAIGISALDYGAVAAGAWISHNTVEGGDSACVTGIYGRASSSTGGGAAGRYGRNLVTGSGYGLSVNDPSAVVGRNSGNQNYHTGIWVQRSGTLVKDNAANDNGTYGINAATGVVDGGGNTATGNGVQNCAGVSCP